MSRARIARRCPAPCSRFLRRTSNIGAGGEVRVEGGANSVQSNCRRHDFGEEFWRVDAVEGTRALTPAHPRPGAAVGPAGLARGPVTSGRRGRGRLPHPLNRRRPIHAPRPLRAAPGRHGRILLVRAVEVASRHRWEPRDTRVVPGERREASRGYRRVARAGALAEMGVAQIYFALKRAAAAVEQSGSFLLMDYSTGARERRAFEVYVCDSWADARRARARRVRRRRPAQVRLSTGACPSPCPS